MPAAAAATNTGNGSALVGVAVVAFVVILLVAAVTWFLLRFRSTEPLFREGVSDVRAEVFAAGVLREFRNENGADAEAGKAETKIAAGPGTNLLEEPAPSTLGVSAPSPMGASTLSESFRTAVGAFTDAIRDLAVQVEQAALAGDGAETARATRAVAAFTAGLGALPMKEVLDAAVPTPAADKGTPLGRSTTFHA